MLRATKLYKGQPLSKLQNSLIYVPKLLQLRHTRYYSSDVDPAVTKEVKEESVPWYVNMVNREKLIQQQTPVVKQVIEFPKKSPQSLKHITSLIKDKLGIVDILIFDLKEQQLLEPYENDYSSAISGICDFMIIGTAKSNKHCESAFIELNKFLKKEYNIVATVEGNINSNDEKKRKRRLAKKNNYSGSLSSVLSPTLSKESWYMIDCGVDNIFVNILTPMKRDILNLEELYAPESQKASYVRSSIENEEEKLSDSKDNNLLMDSNGNNNVLMGLKRLALEKRRNYSTLNEATMIFSKIKKLIETVEYSNFDESTIELSNLLNIKFDDNLKVLEAIHNGLQSLHSKEITKTKLENVKMYFDYNWPMKMNRSEADEYWKIRSSFLSLLNLIDPKAYTPKNYYNDYLVFKKVSSYNISDSDLESFLKLTIRSLQVIDNPNYWDLVKSNKYIVKSLKLVNDDSILQNEKIINLLLNSMILNNSKHDHLHALYEVINYLVYFHTSNNQGMPNSIVISILNTLAEVNRWNSIWKVWNQLNETTSYNKDSRPWAHLINLMVEKGGNKVYEDVVNNKQLLWIKRNNVPVDKDLEDALTKLFQHVNKENIEIEELQKFLLAK